MAFGLALLGQRRSQRPLGGPRPMRGLSDVVHVLPRVGGAWGGRHRTARLLCSASPGCPSGAVPPLRAAQVQVASSHVVGTTNCPESEQRQRSTRCRGQSSTHCTLSDVVFDRSVSSPTELGLACIHALASARHRHLHEMLIEVSLLNRSKASLRGALLVLI